MTGSTKLRARLGAAAAIAGVTVLVAACGSTGAGSTGAGSTGGGSATVGSAAAPTASATPAADKLATISVASRPDGSHLVGTGGRAIYLWKGDTGSRSSCTGACAKGWPPVLAPGGVPHAAGGVASSALGTINRGHGQQQVTYHGHPLYTFVEDAHSGTANGQGSDAFGARWFLVTAAGTADTTTSGSSSSGAGTTTTAPTAPGGYSGAPATSSTTSPASGGW